MAHDLNIIYEDNHIIVAEKPRNMPAQADSSGDADMLSAVKEYIKEKYKKPGSVYAGLVHRLDRPTGGLMVFARTSKAASRLSKQIRSGGFEKKYYAVLEGIPQKSGRLEDFLIKDRDSNTVRVGSEGDPDAKIAILDYTVVKTAGNRTLADITLETGRSHQIRVQFANIGTPLLGDARYGRKDPDCGLALFAYSLSFTHPTTKEKMTFTLMPPDEYPWNIFDL